MNQQVNEAQRQKNQNGSLERYPIYPDEDFHEILAMQDEDKFIAELLR